MTEESKTSDFNKTGDDVKRLTKKETLQLNPFQQFEKKFPFYQMDVNGFMLRVREAMAKEQPDQAKTLYNVKTVTLDTIQEAF